MATINTNGIASGSLIFPEHVLRSIEALNGTAGPFDISLSGSLVISGSTGNTGLKISSGSILENVTPQRYLAVISHSLNRLGLITPNSKVVVEKPIGENYKSSVLVNNALAEVFKEIFKDFQLQAILAQDEP